MRSVLEEKTTRIVEVLVSSMRPFQLLVGKVVGVGSVGVLQFVIWTASGFAIYRFRGSIMDRFGVAGADTFSLPAISGGTIAVIITYFLLGYFLYSAMFAVVGASVTSEQEAQQAQTPVMMLLVASIVLMMGVLNDANSGLAVALTIIPFSAAILMPLRWTATAVPTTDLVLSLAVLIGTTILMIWLASRIYRVGILMYGKRASVKEMVRWIRAS